MTCRLKQTCNHILSNDPVERSEPARIMVDYKNEMLFGGSSAERAVGRLIQLQEIPRFKRQLERRPKETLQAFRDIRDHRTLLINAFCVCSSLTVT